MPISLNTVKMYLALEGHLPETFLLENLFDVEPSKAKEIAAELERLVIENNPAVRSIHVAGRRKQLRKQYGMPEVADEEIAIMQGATIAHSLGQANGLPRVGGVQVTGNLGEMLGNIINSIGGSYPPGAEPHAHTEQDRPSDLGVEDFLRGMGRKPTEPEEGEEDASEE